MTERGYIALARGTLDHPIVGVRPRTPYSPAEAWQWLLFEAAWKPRRYSAGGIVVELKRGQLAHSTRYMAQAWRWSETRVRRFLERLKTGAGTGAMIGADTGAGITVITVCNYERYQSPQVESGADGGAQDGAASGAKWRTTGAEKKKVTMIRRCRPLSRHYLRAILRRGSINAASKSWARTPEGLSPIF